MITTRLAHLRLVAGCLLAMMALVLAASAARAQSRSVSNTALAMWESGGQQQSVRSNTVSFDVSASTAAISTWTPAPGEADRFSLYASYCIGPVRQNTAVADPVSVAVAPTPSLHIGQTLIIRIAAPLANRDHAAVDHLELHVTAASGDTETLDAVETGDNSGVFLASIATLPASQASPTQDCRLSLAAGNEITVAAFADKGSEPFAVSLVTALADPFGMVFDSRDGSAIDGAVVSLVDAATGLPAPVFAFDGVTPYPATITSGGSVTDASGQVTSFQPGEYRFPLVPFGTYLLVVSVPAPYTAPSIVGAGKLASLRDPTGGPFTITPASYGEPFSIDQLTAVEVDIPADGPRGRVTIQKTASRDVATAGDAIFYTVMVRNADGAVETGPLTLRDLADQGLRLQPDSLRVDGSEPVAGLVRDGAGRGFTAVLSSLAPGQSHRVTYAMSVREDASLGTLRNVATTEASDASTARAEASVRVIGDMLTRRMTIVGQVVAGDCSDTEAPLGVPGVRIMLEDGSYAVTDRDGRYHFEGVAPGTHVVQAARATLPQGAAIVECAATTRNGGSAISRLVSGRGGSLHRADFFVSLPEGGDLAMRGPAEPVAIDNITASGAKIDFLGLGDGPDGFLFPAEGHNPRAPSIRVAIRHRGRHRVELTVDGHAVDPLSFDGTDLAADGTFAVSTWRGIALENPHTLIVATINDRDGRVVGTYQREIDYATTPLNAEFVAEQSHLVADGATAPVLAVRLTDRRGRPVHAGISGSLTLASPYETLSALEAQQNAELSGFGSIGASWTVTGDDGIAHIALAPTMVSGKLTATFSFTDGATARGQDIEAWIEPGDQPWTLVGLAEGSLGARTVADHMEWADDFSSDLGEKARVAFYAKGRVLGRYLLTLAYDSAGQRDDKRLLGTIDPAAYYTVFGDRSQRLYDAASRERLYVRIESRTFYALYGDFQTGFDETRLGRYQRVLTGAQAHARLGSAEVQAFAAQVGSHHRRRELQGDGTSGPYDLGSQSILPNSEVIVLEVRDRLRSEIIVDRRELVRFVDYTIDPLSGTIRFSEPVLSRDAALNPRFIVADFDTDGLGNDEWNGGVRARLATADGKLRLGATLLSDSGDEARTNLGSVDARLLVASDTEVRLEAGASVTGGVTSQAYLAQVEHYSEQLDARAYFSQVANAYGVGQGNLAEQGHRKIGADARVRLGENLSVSGSVWHDDGLEDGSERQAGELRAAWQSARSDAFAGIVYLSDHLADGRSGSSTVLQAGATQRLLDNRLEVSGATSVPLGTTEAIDLPARQSVGLRYAVAPWVRLLGSYEVARSEQVDANTAKFGAELTPWRDSRVIATVGQEQLGAGSLANDVGRQFAAVTLGQSLRLGDGLVIEATVDANRTLAGGIAAEDVFEPAQPISSGGQLGASGTLGEDFTALTLGASLNRGAWSARARGEWRDGEFANRRGLDLAAIRQLGEGSVVGSGIRWTRSVGRQGGLVEITEASLSAAHRPDGSHMMFLAKLDYRSDEISGSTGAPDATTASSWLTAGNALSRRLLGSVSGNWAPGQEREGEAQSEVALMLGVRHNFDRVEEFDLAGTTVISGLDARVAIGERFEIGGTATLRHDLHGGTTSFAFGPELGVLMAERALVSIGYNVSGFRDPDFSAARTTDRGVFIRLRVRFDDFSLEHLGIGRR